MPLLIPVDTKSNKSPIFYYIIIIIDIISIISPYIFLHLASLSGGNVNPNSSEFGQLIDYTKSPIGIITNFFSNGLVSVSLMLATLVIGLVTLIKYKDKIWGRVLIVTSIIYFLSHALALFSVLGGLA